MRVLVTGGAGFIGRHLCDALVERGDDVIVYDSMERQAQPRMPRYCATRTLSAGRLMPEDARSLDAVVHLGALVGVGQSQYEVRRYVRGNTLDTAALLERLVEYPPKRLVVASSMSVYGEGAYALPDRGHIMRYPRPRTIRQVEECAQTGDWEHYMRDAGHRSRLQHMATSEKKPLQPASVYAITKRDQEELCLVVGAAYGIPTVALRFGNVYGRGQALGNPYTGAVAIFAARARTGVAPIVYEDGQQLRDFTHVSDVIRGILLALDSDVRDEAINLGTGVATPIIDVARSVSEYYDAPWPELPGTGRAGDVRHCYLEVSRARAALGFQADVPLSWGLSDLLAWVDAQNIATPNTEYAEDVLRANGLIA